LLLPLLVACPPPGTPATLTVVPSAFGTPLRCGETMEVAGHEVRMRDLRWFAHDIEVVGADGVAHPLVLDPTDWQHGGVALLDHEDACHNGSVVTHDTLEGRTWAQPPYKALRLQVGLPPELNHADPLTLEPPLTTTAMHWGWRQGFKYVRFDVALDGLPTRIHLGATGCEGPMGAVTGCEHRNLGALELPLDGTVARLELGPALAHTTDGCMSAPDDRACIPWFEAFGIDHPTTVAQMEAP